MFFLLFFNREAIYPLEIMFTSGEKRITWEATVSDAKQKLGQWVSKASNHIKIMKLKEYIEKIVLLQLFSKYTTIEHLHLYDSWTQSKWFFFYFQLKCLTKEPQNS